ncbi:hypothetical protein ND748_07870 [Frankia sp. AiPs1]|uniref:hypothetical protein n=1 Tax=Frankia sp. AiPs1 TaxID=573493 RepID=UPI0020433BD1|nr:hypothetical protein [Frankia sp. AiPs1]MCM3921582.1 hypothetical protein [Frankia sp. AiPs1]
MTVYLCPRSDLACAERFLSTGDLDYHLHLTHGYRAFWRIVASVRPDHPLPIGPRPTRHVPDGLVETPDTPALVESQGTPALDGPQGTLALDGPQGTLALDGSQGTPASSRPRPTPELERIPAAGARTAAHRGAHARARRDIRARSRAGARAEKAGRTGARDRAAEPNRRRRRLRISR